MHMPPPSAEAMDRAVKLGHEPSAISVKGVIWFLICLVLTIAVTFAFIWAVWYFLLRQEAKSDLPNSALSSTVKEQAPPGPVLQPSIGIHEHIEHEDLDGMHASENERFSQMGWLHSDGEVRVSDNIANQVIQLTKEKGTAAPAYNGWSMTGVPTGASTETK